MHASINIYTFISKGGGMGIYVVSNLSGKHKNGSIPSHKVSQNFSIKPFDSKFNFRKSMFLHMK